MSRANLYYIHFATKLPSFVAFLVLYIIYIIFQYHPFYFLFFYYKHRRTAMNSSVFMGVIMIL